MRQILPAASPALLDGPVEAVTWETDNPGVGEFGVGAFLGCRVAGDRVVEGLRAVGFIAT